MMRLIKLLVFVLLCCGVMLAETGEQAWLRYARLDAETAKQYDSLPATLIVAGDSPLLKSAQSEMLRGVHGMLGRTLRVSSDLQKEPAFVIGTFGKMGMLGELYMAGRGLKGDEYSLITREIQGQKCIVITGGTDRGALYGTFALLSKIARGQSVADLSDFEEPSAPLRWVNQWDNLDGSIERGYAGNSIFFENRKVRADLTRASEYARLLASVGINGCVVSNVNADMHIVDTDFIPQLARIADVFRPYGLQLGVAVNVAMPKEVGGLDTFDPLDPKVANWWKNKVDELYKIIPDFGGFVVKADSEGQLGPSVYGRNPAEAANVIAKALKPHGGIVFYRAFVYNHHLDWNDKKADRARAAYDIFHPLDGKFDDNVIIQTKHGPIDFQVREPVSPLFGGLEKTNQAIELQITQEYLGQQRHTVFIVPMWKEALDFDLRVNGQHTPVKEIVAGRSFHRPTGGYVGVANVGLDINWLHNHLASANLYGFGRLSWNPDLTSQAIAEEWTRLTFSNDPVVVQTTDDILLASWPTYENYTGVLGLQTLTNITGPHYGPAPESQERNGWGQWIRAEKDGVGMDRTVATGTGYVGQYSPDVQRMYEPLATTPDELLTFFHHVPYTYKLHSGKTVIQSIYDSHYDGAAKTKEFVATWKTLKGKVDDQRYYDVLRQLKYQSGHATVWRDAIDQWFEKVSGIPDAKGRVGHELGRVEAEAMDLKGYQPVELESWEGASGGKAIECSEGAQSCSALTKFNGTAGWHQIDVQYFDLGKVASTFRLFVNSQMIDEWKADMVLPGRVENEKKLSADGSVRHRVKGVALRPGDVIRIEGVPDGYERAPLDYLEVLPMEGK